MKRLWLSSEILEWVAISDSADYLSDHNWRRAYQIWTHAEQTLQNHDDEFHRVDAVSSLKRSMSHRVQLLKSIYQFDKIPIGESPRRTIEQLAFWGIVRPTMLVKLIDIRNAVEHEDAAPPEGDRCRELLDFVWYFLRSTDVMVAKLLDTFSLEDQDTDYSLSLETGPQREWKVTCNGWVHESMLSEASVNDWIEVEVHEKETPEEFRTHLPAGAHFDRQAGDTFINGLVCGSLSHIRKFVGLYFDIAQSAP